jgi:hypothetical protein
MVRVFPAGAHLPRLCRALALRWLDPLNAPALRSPLTPFPATPSRQAAPLGFETLCLHAGQELDKGSHARAVPIYATSSFTVRWGLDARKPSCTNGVID